MRDYPNLKFHVTFLRIVDCNIVRFLLFSFFFLAIANIIACYHKKLMRSVIRVVILIPA